MKSSRDARRLFVTMKMKTVVVGVVEDVVAEDLDMVVVDTGNEDDGKTKSLLSILFLIFLSFRYEHSAGVSSILYLGRANIFQWV